MTGGSGSDYFDIRISDAHASQDENNDNIITDFSNQDMIDVLYHNARFENYSSITLLDLLDTNQDNFLTGSDGFSTTAEGVNIGIGQSGSALTIFLGEGSIRFENVTSIASADSQVG